MGVAGTPAEAVDILGRHAEGRAAAVPTGAHTVGVGSSSEIPGAFSHCRKSATGIGRAIA
jgi:hypothetical protein